MAALFAMIAVSIAAPDKDAIMAKEKAAWQTFKDKKSDEFKKLLHADFMGVYGEGVYPAKTGGCYATVGHEIVLVYRFQCRFPRR